MRWKTAAVLLCGWVLWVNSGSDAKGWAVLGAWETYRECDFKARDVEQKMKATEEKMGALGKYMCLPAGTDPRPR